MKVIMTGGTGLVGTDIVKMLLQNGAQVTLWGRQQPAAGAPGLDWVEMDFMKEGLEKIEKLPEPDVLVHGAAVLRPPAGSSPFEAFRKVNMEASEQLFTHFTQKKKVLLVYISSFSFLQRPLRLPIDEEHPTAPRDLYGITKYWAEQALEYHAGLHGSRYITLRVSSPVPDNIDLLPDTVVAKWIAQAKSRKPLTILGTGNRTQNFVATSDIARALVQTIEKQGVNGVFNIASATQLSMRDLARIICDRFGVETVSAGTDPNEEERWEIAIEKAKNTFHYDPEYTSAAAIHRLLATL